MLFVALLAIAATAIAPTLAFQAKRDREEELIHRGVQYSRGIRRYVKKFGRYPTRLEELENTNNIRFLRKRYKDPITGEDFRLLHIGEVKISFTPGIQGAAGAGQNPAAGLAAMGQAALGQMAQTAAGLGIQGVNSPSQPTGGGAQSKPGADPDAEPDDASPGAGFSGPVFGGGPIVGVASTSKEKTIREFNKLNRYNKWQFIYDPSSDRGGLLNTPAQPAIGGTSNAQAGKPGQPAQQPGGFGAQPPPPTNPPSQDPQN